MVFDEHYLFKKDVILECFRKQEEHPRYAFAVHSFIESSKTYISDSIRNIDELLDPKDVSFDDPIAEIVIKVAIPAEASPIDRDYHLGYELSKLFDRGHRMYGVDYFKQKFENHPELIEELDNMDRNKNDVLEYYCSYDYLCHLLAQKGYKR